MGTGYGGGRIKPWKRLGSKLQYSSKWCSVRVDRVQLPSGKIIDDYNVVQLRDVVMVFGVADDNLVPFVRQYRYGAGKILVQLPAGTYDAGRERPAEAARRELWEETGYRAETLDLLGVIHDYPTKNTNSLTVYFARGLVYEGGNVCDETEDIENITIQLGEIDGHIENGEIADAGTIAAVYLARRHLQGQSGGPGAGDA